MSLPRLLVVAFVLSSLSVAFAEDQPRQPENSSPTFIRPYSGNPTSRFKLLPRYNFSFGDLSSRTIPNPNSDATCYTMRTYVADRNFDRQFVLKPGVDGVSYPEPARDGSQTDSNLPGIYTTCQPSSQFAVKMTDQPVENGNDRK